VPSVKAAIGIAPLVPLNEQSVCNVCAPTSEAEAMHRNAIKDLSDNFIEPVYPVMVIAPLLVV
jgi:hypothetical protein